MADKEKYDLENISGIGETYADYLKSEGYEHVHDLLNADPYQMQMNTDLFNAKRAKNIINSAKDFYREKWEDMQFDAGEGFYDAGENNYIASDGKKLKTEEDLRMYEKSITHEKPVKIVSFDRDVVNKMSKNQIRNIVYEAAEELEEE
jgi:hypothetical protein